LVTISRAPSYTLRVGACECSDWVLIRVEEAYMTAANATKPTLVVGATGNIGRQVVFQLAAIGAPVRVMARNPDSNEFPPVVEIVQGDLTLPETLDRCLSGIDTVFLVWTAPQAAVNDAVKLMAKHSRRIVFLSAPIKTPHPFFQQPNANRVLMEKIEQRIESSGLEWTFLRPGMLAMNSRHFWGPQIRSGSLVRWPYLSAPTAPIDERDIGAVAVRVLSESGHGAMEYVLTGPESLSQSEQVATIGRVIGKALQIEEITPDEARVELGATMPAAVVNMLLDAWAAAIGQAAFITTTVEQITGNPARTFGEWATDNASEFLAGD